MTASAADADEAHVAGFVVRAYPDSVDAVARRIARLPGAIVHAAAADGKLVVTLEACSADVVADTLCRIQTLDGVLAAALVYQHIESAAQMNEEVDIEDHAT